MSNLDIEHEVRTFIVDNFILDAGTLEGDTSLTRSGVLDSMGVLELIMFLEHRYGLSVPDQDAVPENLDTIERIVGYVQRRTAAGGTAAGGTVPETDAADVRVA